MPNASHPPMPMPMPASMDIGALRQQFDYDAAAVALDTASSEQDGDVTVSRVSFPSTDGSTVRGLLYVPSRAGRKPAIVTMPGLGGSASDQRSDALGLAKLGAICLADAER